MRLSSDKLYKSIEAGQRYFPKEVIIANVRSYEENMLKKYNPEELASPEMPPVFVFETDDDRQHWQKTVLDFTWLPEKQECLLSCIFSEKADMVSVVEMITDRPENGNSFL